MKKFMMLLLSVIFVALITSSIQSISADHLEPGQGIFVSEQKIELVTTRDTNYQIYLQVVNRNVDGHLISVVESLAHGSVMNHNLTDHVFDTLMGEKEIIVIDGVQYKKGQWEFSPSLEERFVGLYPIYSEIKMKFTSERNDDTKLMYESKKDYAQQKIHYCAEFKGHGYNCIPIFEVQIPTMILDPSDTVTQKWIILRELD